MVNAFMRVHKFTEFIELLLLTMRLFKGFLMTYAYNSSAQLTTYYHTCEAPAAFSL